MLAAALLVATAGLTAPAATLSAGRPCIVTNGSARYSSLQTAVNAARTGAIIVVRGRCVGATVINKPLTIQGKQTKAYGTPTLDGAGANVLSDSASISVRDVVIRGGGTGIVVGRKSDATTIPVMRLTRVRITDNAAGMDIDLADVRIRDSSIYDNGDGVSADGWETTLSLLRSSIHDNGGTGVVALFGPAVTLTDSAIHHNTGNGMTQTDTAGVTMRGRSSIHHNSDRGVSLDGSRLRLYDDSSIYRNAGAGASGNTGYITCSDRSSIHHNRGYGVRFGQRGGRLTGCVGRRVHDNDPNDLYLAPGTLVVIDGVVVEVPVDW